MAMILDVYKCPKCGNVMTVLNSEVPGTPPSCCYLRDPNDPADLDRKERVTMAKLDEKSGDVLTEKHVPFIEKQGNGIRITMGKPALHPMLADHYIQWVEVVTKDDRSYRKFLLPGQQPIASFEVKLDDVARVREFCTLHDLWRS